MNDRDLSQPATRQRTSNAFRPALRRTANTRTSNELTAILPLEMTGTPPSQPHHKTTSRHHMPLPQIPDALPGKKQPSDRHPAPAADSAGLTGPPPAGPVISAITSAR